MRIDFVQKVIDILRGKEILFVNKPRLKTKHIYNHEIDVLFEKFENENILINGEMRKRLKNVNAMYGVTESSLTLMCKLYPDKEQRKNIKVLNVGCGRKGQNEFLTELGFQVFGVDFDIENDTENVKFHDLNTQENLPFEESMFDCVICQEIIEHIENPWLLFRKIKRVLKINGHLILTTPNISSFESKKYFIGNNYGFSTWFNDKFLWNHINPIPYWELNHIASYNNFEKELITGNMEYYLKFKSNKLSRLDTTLLVNSCLVFLFVNKDNEIKLYQPTPTYNHIWDE